MTNSEKRKLRHGIEYCFGNNCYSMPIQGEQIDCRCGRRWRGVEGRWKLVVTSAGFGFNEV